MEENAPLIDDTILPTVDAPTPTVSSPYKPMDLSIPKIEYKPIDYTPVNFDKLFQKKEKKILTAQEIADSLPALQDSVDYGGRISRGQAQKYDGDLGYTTYGNNDDIYAGTDWTNYTSGFKRFATETATHTFNIFDDIKNAYNEDETSKKLYDNKSNASIKILQDTMQYVNPIFKTEYAQNHSWNKLATGNSAEFLPQAGMIAGSMIKNIGFDIAVAAAGALLIPETGGASAVASGVAIAKNSKSIFKNLNLLSSLFSDGKAVKAVYDGVKGGAKLAEVVKGMATTRRVLNSSYQIGKGMLLSSGEAALEAYAVTDEIRRKMRNDHPEMTEEEINKTAQAAGDITYGLNQAILSVSNINMFGKALVGKYAADGVSKLPLAIKNDMVKGTWEMVQKEGWQNTYLPQIAKHILKDGAMEGLEEVSQSVIQNSVKDYYGKKMSKTAQEAQQKTFNDIMSSSATGLSSQFSAEGFDNFLSGMLLGSGAQVIGAVSGSTIGRFDKLKGVGNEYSYPKWQKTMEAHKEAFNSTKVLFDNIATEATEKPIISNDDIYTTQSKHNDFLHNLTLSNIKRGTYETLLSGIKEWESPVFSNEYKEEDYIKAVNEFTKNQFKIENVAEAKEAFSSIARKIERNKIAYDTVSNAFSTNPYNSDNTFTTLIRSIARKPGKKEEDAIKATIWEASKDQAIKLQADLYNGINRENTLSKKVFDNLIEARGDKPIDAEHNQLLQLFYDNPVQSLNNGNNKNIESVNHYQNMITSLQKMIDDKQQLLNGLPKEYLDVLSERQTIMNNIKFYDNIAKNLTEGNIEGFYTDFYKLLTGVEDIDENKLNEFILDSTDIIKLKLGNKFLHTATNTFTSIKGQKKLITENINNLGFYLGLQQKRKEGYTVTEVESSEPVATSPVAPEKKATQTSTLAAKPQSESIKKEAVAPLKPIVFKDEKTIFKEILTKKNGNTKNTAISELIVYLINNRYNGYLSKNINSNKKYEEFIDKLKKTLNQEHGDILELLKHEKGLDYFLNEEWDNLKKDVKDYFVSTRDMFYNKEKDLVKIIDNIVQDFASMKPFASNNDKISFSKIPAKSIEEIFLSDDNSAVASVLMSLDKKKITTLNDLKAVMNEEYFDSILQRYSESIKSLSTIQDISYVVKNYKKLDLADFGEADLEAFERENIEQKLEKVIERLKEVIKNETSRKSPKATSTNNNIVKTQKEVVEYLKSRVAVKRITTPLGYILEEGNEAHVEEIKKIKENKTELAAYLVKNNIEVYARVTQVTDKKTNSSLFNDIENTAPLKVGNLTDNIYRNVFAKESYSFDNFMKFVKNDNDLKTITDGLLVFFDKTKEAALLAKKELINIHKNNVIFVTDDVFVAKNRETLSEDLQGKLSVHKSRNISQITDKKAINFVGVAGTYDLLVVDENGDLYSYDFKSTKPKEGEIDYSKYNSIETYTTQQQTYAILNDIEVKGMGIIISPVYYETKNDEVFNIIKKSATYEKVKGDIFIQDLLSKNIIALDLPSTIEDKKKSQAAEKIATKVPTPPTVIVKPPTGVIKEISETISNRNYEDEYYGEGYDDLVKTTAKIDDNNLSAKYSPLFSTKIKGKTTSTNFYAMFANYLVDNISVFNDFLAIEGVNPWDLYYDSVMSAYSIRKYEGLAELITDPNALRYFQLYFESNGEEILDNMGVAKAKKPVRSLVLSSIIESIVTKFVPGGYAAMTSVVYTAPDGTQHEVLATDEAQNEALKEEITKSFLEKINKNRTNLIHLCN